MNSRNPAQLLTLFTLGSLLLAACGTAATEAPAALNSMEGAYTAAALTLTSAAPAAATPPLTAVWTLTSWPTSSNIALAFSTPTFHAATQAPVSTCDNAAYVSDVTIPDGTEITAGESFTKTWAILNTGTCTWTTAYVLTFYSGEDMDGSAPALTAAVAPNETVYISVELTAPSTIGSYTGFWRLANASGTGFGATVYVMITVGNATATPTLTPTTETEVTSTPTPTDTPLPTETETPTAEATVDSVTAVP